MENLNKRDKVVINVLNQMDEREHFHQDIELLYLLEGTAEVSMEQQVTHLQAGDILVINANKRHQIQSSNDVLCMQVQIQFQMVSDVLHTSDIIFWCDSTRDENEKYEKLREVLKVLLKHDLENAKNAKNFGHIALCYRVVDVLNMYFLVSASDKEIGDEEQIFEERIQLINNYIRANYNQPISMKELSEKLYLSNGYLSRFFKKNYGMNFVEYLTNIRLYHAIDDLLYTKTPITRVAYENGFSSMAVFNKAFKQSYGETPTEFRKKRQNKKETAKEVKRNPKVQERLEQFLMAERIEDERMDERENCKEQFTVSDPVRYKNYWKQMINIGSASSLLRSDVREHLILLKDSFDFQYVRFWNIFSDDMLIDFEVEDGNYNFSSLDVIFDFLMNQGIRPHIEMGNKPVQIMYNVQKTAEPVEAMHMQVPNMSNIDIAQWERVLAALMHHLVFRYGREEVNQWRIELWFNEKEWDEQNSYSKYFALFHILYQAVRKYCDETEVGGCGLRMDFNQESRVHFFQEWLQQESKPDFISVGQFAYDRGEEKQDKYSKRSTDNECVKHRLLQERKLLNSAGGSQIPIYVSEWNLTASSRNYMNDTCFKGAYIIKNIMDVYDIVEDIGYYVGSDRTAEYYDSNMLLYGGTGLLSKDGILKPAAFAYEFLNRLYPFFIGKSDNYFITTDKHDSYGIVYHNQRELSYNYYYTEEDKIDKNRIWTYFEDQKMLELEIELHDVTNGTYQVKCYCINEKNGSALDIWKDMGFEKELSRSDIKYFRRVCEPKLTIQKCKAENGILRLKMNLLDNEIGFMKTRLMTE